MTQILAPSLSLSHLLSSLIPTLHPSTFVFLTYPLPTAPPPSLPTQLTFHEREGLTVITTLESALAHNVPAEDYTFACRMITCEVHSSLEAVGFMAVLAKALAERGIPANVVGGWWHDHLFVPVGREEEAVACLERVARDARDADGDGKKKGASERRVTEGYGISKSG